MSNYINEVAAQAYRLDDCQLLKLAAKAAGYPIHSDAWAVGAGGGKPSLYMGNRGPKWNPLIDDGDVLRLAVDLKLDICFYEGFKEVHAGGDGIVSASVEEFSEDLVASTRRAIVRAAAEIGRAMSCPIPLGM